MVLAGLAEGAEGGQVAAHQGLLLGAGPAFELPFAGEAGGGREGPFAVHEPGFPVIRRVFAPVAVTVVAQALGDVPGLPDVVGVVRVLENIDPPEARKPRRRFDGREVHDLERAQTRSARQRHLPPIQGSPTRSAQPLRRIGKLARHEQGPQGRVESVLSSDSDPVLTVFRFHFSIPPIRPLNQPLRRIGKLARHEQGPQGRVEWLPDMDSNHD